MQRRFKLNNILIYLAIIFFFFFGVILGKMLWRDSQKRFCPHCTCRENCRIGYEVEADEMIEPVPMACGWRV